MLLAPAQGVNQLQLERLRDEKGTNKKALGLLAFLNALVAELERLFVLARFEMVPHKVVLAVG
jgi:hypothetical protein